MLNFGDDIVSLWRAEFPRHQHKISDNVVNRLNACIVSTIQSVTNNAINTNTIYDQLRFRLPEIAGIDESINITLDQYYSEEALTNTYLCHHTIRNVINDMDVIHVGITDEALLKIGVLLTETVKHFLERYNSARWESRDEVLANVHSYFTR